LAHSTDRHQHALPPRLARRLPSPTAVTPSQRRWILPLVLVASMVGICISIFALPRSIESESKSGKHSNPIVLDTARLDSEIEQLDRWTTELEVQIQPVPGTSQQPSLQGASK
jgi:hypothetical protein